MDGVLDFIFDNAYSVDAKKAEASARSKYPLLLHKDEKIELAFKDRGGKGRDKKYFTSHRILIKDGKGIGGKCKNYLSVPYHTILAFSVQTAGSFGDRDTEVYVFASGYSKLVMDFSKDNVDVFQIYQLLNSKIKWTHSRGTQDFIDPVPPNMDKKQSGFGDAMDWIGGNAQQVDAQEIEHQFKTEFPILLKDETVEMAFKCGRDTKCFTNRRVLNVDVKGLGKKIEFLSIPYGSIHGFSVQTAGAFLDRDTEIVLYTNMIGENYQFQQDLCNGKANLWAVQKLLCNHVLGEDMSTLGDVDTYKGESQGAGILGILTGNETPIDAEAMNEVLHNDPPILQGGEVVEMAFQGYRDITLFTTKRLVMIDKKGLIGKKVEYFSIPWEKFVAFGIQSAGAFLDFDCEIVLHTEMGYYAGEAGKSGDENTPPTPPIPPRPEQSCFSLDFNKKSVDLFKLKYYLSRRILEGRKLDHGAPIGLEALTSQSPDPEGLERLFQWLGNDQRELDPEELDVEFHTNTKILLDHEKTLMAFKAGRDITIFTNIRIMVIDVQGLVGKKIEYMSLPYTSVHAYSVESAGVWDRDSELNLYTRNRWDLAKIDMDFRSGKTDIMQIQMLLSGFVIGLQTDSKLEFAKKNYEPHEQKKMGMDSLSAAFWGQSKEIDAAELDSKFHSDIPMLLKEEEVLRAFSAGRDMFLYTNRRMIIVDCKGLSGQRVKYKSIPWRNVDGFEFETAGHLDSDAEIYAYTNVSEVFSKGPPRSCGLLYTKHSIITKDTDIYEMGQLTANLTLFGDNHSDDMVPEVEYKD